MERRRVALISCSASKLAVAAPARELYCSTLFRKSVAYAEATCEEWLILSAKYGLVEPDTTLEPYDERLTVEPRIVDGRPITSEWAGAVGHALLLKYDVHGLWNTTFVVLAGGVYERNLRVVTAIHQEYPLAGMQIGERLQWLTQAVSVAS